MPELGAASSGLADPTCFAAWQIVAREPAESARRRCCGNGAVQGDASCFDSSYTRQRCCQRVIARAHGPSRRFLSLGRAQVAAVQLTAACWPEVADPFAAYDHCCDLRHGLLGRKACFNGRNGSLAVFSVCCAGSILEGLDRCNEKTDFACAAGMYEPVNIAGLDSYTMVFDHRRYYGTNIRGSLLWDEVGQVQLNFLKHPQGGRITPESRVLDIGCGALRLGRWLIPWLQPERYTGLDKSRRLIEQGYWFELSRTDRAHKRPRFVASADFEFFLFGRAESPQTSFANSLLTHLTLDDVGRLLSKLRGFVQTGHNFLATYVPPRRDAGELPLAESGANAVARHTLEDLRMRGQSHGWRTEDSTAVWHECTQALLGRSRQDRHYMARFTAV